MIQRGAIRSTNLPANIPPIPYARTMIDIPAEMTDRDQLYCDAIGWTNTPKLYRAP